eukprot:jgi/Bigna1/49410/estExt_Genewise1.C_460084
MLLELQEKGESAAAKYAADLDGQSLQSNLESSFLMSAERRADLISKVPDALRKDIQFAHLQVKRFAEAQKASLSEFTIESEPGVWLGQKLVPVNCAGCYIPGGRYAHIASAIMSVTTAKVAGVPHIVAASPATNENGDPFPAVVYAMDLAGAHTILEMGGVQAIGSMAFGLFGLPKADMLVGPGNAYVAEAKRQLFGEVGIDVFAGPTESAIIADSTADPMTVAIDLLGQAEHGTNSPVWLFSSDELLAQHVMDIIPEIAEEMPSGTVAMQAWENHGEVIFCDRKEDIVTISDEYAPEHLQLLTEENGWYKDRLTNYGSLFVGEGSTVTHGDKCSGTNHILPTKGAARYSGGLNVQKFLKVLTWQELSVEANREFSSVGSRISRAEGMDGHARSCDWRLNKYFPGEKWDFEVVNQERITK